MARPKGTDGQSIISMPKYTSSQINKLVILLPNGNSCKVQGTSVRTFLAHIDQLLHMVYGSGAKRNKAEKSIFAGITTCQVKEENTRLHIVNELARLPKIQELQPFPVCVKEKVS